MTYSVDAGGGSTGFSATPADVTNAGNDLGQTSSDSADRRTYGTVGGCGDYEQVASSVATLMERWDPALTSWQTSLTSLGTATCRAAAVIVETDANLASAWNTMPGPQTGPRP